jgi:hypothetical protein
MPFQPRPLGERLFSKINRTDSPDSGLDGCWEWTAARDPRGYGRVHVTGKRGMALAHRVVYEFLRGPIPSGLELDHLCRRPCCVNPDHLEPVSHRVNSLRSSSPQAENARKTECKHGHPLDGVMKNGRRYCKTCSRLRVARYNAAKKAALMDTTPELKDMFETRTVRRVA